MSQLTPEEQLEIIRPLLRDWLISLEIEMAMAGVKLYYPDHSGGRDMPSKTKKQAAAMRAAAAGKSSIGIPKKVGQEFVAADKKAGKGSARKR